VSRLRCLLRQGNGLTFIQEGTDDTRTFVIVAFGMSFLQLNPKEGSVKGVDVHAPDWFVPVQGVAYLSHPASEAKLREEAARRWSKPNHATLLVLNGLWSLMPERQREILARAETHHVVVADETKYGVAEMQRVFGVIKAPVHVLEVTELDHDHIHIDFRVL